MTQRLYASSLALAVVAGHAGAANLDALNRGSAHGSARIALTGTGFGAGGAGSWVSIGGAAAIPSSWTDSRIVCYVPERTPRGVLQVRAVVNGTPTNSLPLVIGQRFQSAGRVPWRFELDDAYLSAPPVVGHDGTIYAKGIDGHTYSIARNGALNWVFRDGLTASGQVSLAPNGDVVIGGSNNVARLTPGGQLIWWRGTMGTQFLAGPNVGPDGRIYGASNQFYGGIGAFILSADGSSLQTMPLRGNSTGSSYTYAVAFAQDAWYVTEPQPRIGAGLPTVVSFDYSGNQRWVRSGQGQALAQPGGGVYVQRADDGNFYGAYTAGGNVAWAKSFNLFGVPGFHPAIGPDGSVYQVAGGSGLVRFAPSGSVVWERRYPATTLQHGAVTPNGQVVIMNQTFNLSDPRKVRAITQAGNDLWSVDLPFEGGQAVAPFQPFGLSPSSDRAYMGTSQVSPGGDPRAYLYAFSFQDTGPIRLTR